MDDNKLKEKAVEEFKEKLFSKLGKASLRATQDYQTSIRHTGAYLSGSMSVAFSAGVNKMLNILLKEITNVREEEKESTGSDTTTGNG
jgi:hypothetical protein